ncbi:MAG: sigma-70 family RNA polymerase sigma factor [bacterium]|nr:sigma-70 family RNA polymerase sigma factor [bacterium]
MNVYKAHIIEETISKEGARLLNFIRKFVPDKSDAEDIMQDVFYQLTINFDDIRSMDKVSGWMFRVARNKITDRFRKKKPENFSSLGKSRDDDQPLSMEELIPDLGNLPDDDYLREMIWERIEAALAKMPEEQRNVFIMHELEQKTFKEMEEITGKNMNTLLSRKRYAMIFLRKELETFYQEVLSN